MARGILKYCIIAGVYTLISGCQTTSQFKTNLPQKEQTTPIGVQQKLAKIRSIIDSDLPPCPAQRWKSEWNNCFGMHPTDHGNEYYGEFQDDKYHGRGAFYYLGNDNFNGNYYAGEFRDGFFNGLGTYTYRNGAKYVGQFKNDRKQGKGTYTGAHGLAQTGDWHNDKLLENDGLLESQSNRPSTAPKRRTVAQPIPKPNIPIKPTRKHQPRPQSGLGSGFLVSRLGHVVTNEHVVNDCKQVTVGDDVNRQFLTEIISTDKLNDLALLKLTSIDRSSAEIGAFVRKLGIKIIPLAGNGLLRSKDVELGERVMVAGYPYGDIFSDTIKVTLGIVSATRGLGDNPNQFQLDAAVQSGNSGGPIYDSGGNIVGVVVSQLNKLKFAKAIGTLPENVNFGIKASTVKSFLNSSGLPSRVAKRETNISTVELAEIARKQALMVMCIQ